jgi:hypothetical protein
MPLRSRYRLSKTMSFLDSLESNLKNLEAREESASRSTRGRRRRESDRASAMAAAENAARLKSSPYTAELLRQVTRMGHAIRTKVRIMWIGATLRLEARERRLELRPSAEGISAVLIENGVEIRSQRLNLGGKPEDLAKELLKGMSPPSPGGG